jgi:hypothetical protein
VIFKAALPPRSHESGGPPGQAFNGVVLSSLRATGDVGFPIQMAVLWVWCVWVPLAWLLGLGLAGFWIAMMTDEWLRGLLMCRRWKKRRWLKYAQRGRAHATGAGDSPTPVQAAGSFPRWALGCHPARVRRFHFGPLTGEAVSGYWIRFVAPFPRLGGKREAKPRRSAPTRLSGDA